MICLFVIDIFFNLPFRSKLWKLYIVLYEDSEVFGNVYRGWIGPEKKIEKVFIHNMGLIVLCFGVEFLCCLGLLCVFIFLD